MIVYLTQGTARISLEIEGEDGNEPKLSLIQGDTASTAPSSPWWSSLPRPLTLVAVGLLSAGIGYRFAPNRTESLAPPALVEMLPDPSTAPAPSRVAQMPAELRREMARRMLPGPSADPAASQVAQVPAEIQREMANRPVVTRAMPSDAAAKPGDTNPFGLE